MTIKIVKVADRYTDWRHEAVTEYGLDFSITPYTYAGYTIVSFSGTIIGTFAEYTDAYAAALKSKAQMESAGLTINLEVESIGQNRK